MSGKTPGEFAYDENITLPKSSDESGKETVPGVVRP